MPPPEIWPWRYWRAPEGGNTYDPSFELLRQNYNEEGEFDTSGAVDLRAGLVTPTGELGPNAYEILAFLTEARAAPVGTMSMAWFGDNNIDIRNIGVNPNDLGGADAPPWHSFQFHFDSAATSPFWEKVRSETSFDSTLQSLE